MTSPQFPTMHRGGPPRRSTPAAATGPRIPLFSTEFASDPHRFYHEMRTRYGSLVPVELSPGVPATLVIGYHHALRILNDPDHFPADPSLWQKEIPEDCPVKPMMEWRPNAMRTSGADHARYRHATTAGLDQVDRHTVRAATEHAAVRWINTFCESGSADLVGQYAFPVVFDILSYLLGFPPEPAQRMSTGMAMLLSGTDAEQGNTMLCEALFEVVKSKRTDPDTDLTSQLLSHSTDLDDMEVVHQAAMIFCAGVEPTSNLITNTLLLLMTDERFAGEVLGGALSTRDAVDAVLFSDPPVANFCMSYPRQPVLIGDVWLPANEPVVVSLAACNSDPAVITGSRTGNRSHLAWGAGPHACPAQNTALVIVHEAIDQLLDAVPELTLTCRLNELTWRPSPFHRAVTALPVTFPPSPPLQLPS